MAETPKTRLFGFRDKLGYLMGDFGNDFTFILSTMILMKFYTDVMGVKPAIVGAIMMIARIVDAFTDVTMGGMFAGMIIGIGLPMIAYEKIDGVETLIGSKVTIAAAIFSVLAVVSYLICFALTTERVVPSEEAQAQVKGQGVAVMLKNAIKNRALISIIVASIVMLLAQLTMHGMAGYIYPDYYNSAMAQSASTMMMVGITTTSAGTAVTRL